MSKLSSLRLLVWIKVLTFGYVVHLANFSFGLLLITFSCNNNTTIIHNFSTPYIGYLIQIILSRWFKVFEPTNKDPSEFNWSVTRTR